MVCPEIEAVIGLLTLLVTQKLKRANRSVSRMGSARAFSVVTFRQRCTNAQKPVREIWADGLLGTKYPPNTWAIYPSWAEFIGINCWRTDNFRMAASLDRKRLGVHFCASGISIRGVFDKEVRRKPLAFAADAWSYGI